MRFFFFFFLNILPQLLVGYIRDDMGLHKVSNRGHEGAISLHLYTPPFKLCKVWAEGDKNANIHLDEWQDGVVGFYSVYGHRTPHLEGTKTSFTRVMVELRQLALLSNETII